MIELKDLREKEKNIILPQRFDEESKMSEWIAYKDGADCFVVDGKYKNGDSDFFGCVMVDHNNVERIEIFEYQGLTFLRFVRKQK